MTIRVGTVKSINPQNCTARVLYEDTGLLSGELQLTYKGTKRNKEYFMPAIEEQVLVAITDQKVGYILKSIYSEEDKPPVTQPGKYHLEFEDGTVIDYDSETHTLLLKVDGAVNIEASGNVTVVGDVVADGISLSNHTHTGVNGETSPPTGGG